jgi:hypothetical protein
MAFFGVSRFIEKSQDSGQNNKGEQVNQKRETPPQISQYTSSREKDQATETGEGGLESNGAFIYILPNRIHHHFFSVFISITWIGFS